MLHADVYAITNRNRFNLSILECVDFDGEPFWTVFDPTEIDPDTRIRVQHDFDSYPKAAALYRQVAHEAIEAEIDAMRPD